MAFGFGFNKQKALSAAEKYVQQGKIQNAISEYEKVSKNDPKDLTVTNTIGDLYSRLGEADKATECFKTVGDAYATQGFTVKAIAMYKKISKLKPSLESVLKLAELYTQQGLFNDARAQYLQVAEEFLKANELDNAVRIFQKILEMDPENTNMRVRLAEVYIRLGKKNDAWQIFSAAAETLRAKGSLSAAEEVLQRMLTLDPGNSYALLMQGRNLLEAGDAEAAIECLQKVSDLDSNPDGLRDLLKAFLKGGRLSDAGTLASKLLTIHNDLASISTFADALMQAGQHENALQVYDQHSDRLLAEDSDRVLKNLHTIIGHVRDNPASLEKLLNLFQKAGESTHLTEVIELLAHASVQAGDLPRARDLYQKLASMEPGNPLHMQNYQQVASQLGGPAAERLISAEEAAVIVDELEATSPSIHQHYPDAVALAVRSALTDAELFISYNMPSKALGPLLAALPQAPTDLRLNQRLAALHTRATRFAEAGVCCRTLQSVYSDAGYPEEATRYGELATRYEQRSSAPEITELDSEVAETASEEILVEAASAAPWPSAGEPVEDEPEFAVVSDQATDQEFSVQAPESDTSAVAEIESAPGEVDLSSEWDDSLTVEGDTELPEIPVGAHEIPSVEAPEPKESSEKKLSPEKTAETVEEIRFYLEHGMPEQAAAAFEKLESLTDDEATLNALRGEIEAASQPAPSVEEEIAPVEDISEFSVEEVSAEPAVEEIPEAIVPSSEPEISVSEIAPPPIEHVEAPAVEVAAVEAPPVEAPAAEPVPAPAFEKPIAAPVEAKSPRKELGKEPKIAPTKIAATKIAAAAKPVVELAPEAPAAAPAVLQEFVSDLESSLGEGFLPGAVAHKAETAIEAASAETHPSEPVDQPELEPIGESAPTTFGLKETEVMGEFVADLEASLGPDFLKDAPVAEAEPQPAPVQKVQPPAPQPVPPAPQPQAVPAVASAAAAGAASVSATVSAQTAAPVQQQSAAAPAAPKLPAPASLIPSAPAITKSSPFAPEAGIDLAEMFGELKQDLESGAASTDEDPETHYNLGIAFREMGLLDEAIGELQKTCQAVEHGHPFPQLMQTYTWLAQCFLDKGVPEAAIRWYHKALESPIDGETATALHYELASAYEAAGDKPAALKHFLEVYGRNIDYRDVAERIKPLRS
ncbi:MAG: tetratricopeptide repeat protein [Candidatus Acidiferrales bacterium]